MLEKYFSQYFINLRLLTSISIHKCSGNNVWQSITYKQQQNKIKISYLKQASCYFFFKMTFKTDEFSRMVLKVKAL